MTEPEIEAMIERAAKAGAKQALCDLGLADENGREDIRDLRTLLASFRAVKRTILQTTVRVLTMGFLAALMAGAAIKFKLFGAGQ